MQNPVSFIKKYKYEIVNFVVGGVVLAFELVASRVIAPYMGTTIYVWTSIIGVILASLAIGYMVGGHLADSRNKFSDIAYLLAAGALAIALTGVAKDFLVHSFASMELPLQLKALLASLYLFAPATILLGAVSPYLAKLSIDSIKSSGRRISRVSAAGTLGSLFGTFVTGYWLFGVMGTNSVLTVLVLTLLALSLFVQGRRFSRVMAVVGMAVLLLFFGSHLTYSSVVRDFDTEYGRYYVRDYNSGTGTRRALQADPLAWQSAIYVNQPNKTASAYVQSLVDLVNSQPQAKNFLIVGGGAFTLPEYVAAHHDNAEVSVVEIDKELFLISKQYFGVKTLPNLHVYNKDGREYLNSNSQKYDMVVIDAYNSFTPPFQLATRESMQHIRAAISAKGVAVFNVLATNTPEGHKYINSIFATGSSVFKHAAIYQITHRSQDDKAESYLMVASSTPFNAAVRGSLAGYEQLTPPTNGLVLTDNFAPVEQLSARQFKRTE